MKQITIFGAGAWGTALAYVFRGTGIKVKLWSKNLSIVDDINLHQKNSKYTSDCNLGDVKASTDLRECLKNYDILINALPSYAIKDVFIEAKPFMKNRSIIINASKGMDKESHLMPYQIFDKIFNSEIDYFSLSGPSFAFGLLNNNPTTINIAGKNSDSLRDLTLRLRNNNFYTAFSTDVTGVEWGGIYKNVVAIAAGLAEGLGYGENTSALVFSAGFKEMARSGVVLGAHLETFYEPCGVGDLMLSTSSIKSRNFSFGFYLAREKDAKNVLENLNGIAEGYYTLQSVAYLKKKFNLNLPLSDMLYDIIFQMADHQKAFKTFLEKHFA